MQTSKHIMLALALLMGLSSAEIAFADDTAAPAAGTQTKAPTRTHRLGKRLRKLGGRLHRKKAPAAAAPSGTAPSGTAPAGQ